MAHRAATFIGTVTMDAIALVDAYPAADERVLARDLVTAGGGPAATAAVAAARAGIADVRFVGAVGADEAGERAIADLTDAGIDVSGVRRIEGEPTASSVIIVDHGSGTRAICGRPGPRLTLDAEQLALVGDAGWVHVDHVGWPALTGAGLTPTTTERSRISVDAGNPIEDFSPKGVDLFVPTEAALARMYGDGDLPALLDAALGAGARTVVATRGGAGAVAATEDGQRVDVPAHRGAVLSTLGAGDVFHGALLAAVLRDSAHATALADAVRYATVAAGLSCRALDGRSGIPSHDEIVAHLPAH
ncbi:MAG: ribokinase [Actinophytocola sp.]|nr:ribokinase [Actinophytocola sp.]